MTETVARDPDHRQSVRIGITGRVGTIGKHYAANDAHLRAIIARLDAAGDAEAADTISWLVWLRDIDRQREAFILADLRKMQIAAEDRA